MRLRRCHQGYGNPSCSRPSSTSCGTAKVPVTFKEYLTLMSALEADCAGRRVEDFYYLSRAALVKDERYLDRFDQVFGHVFKGLELMSRGGRGRDPRGVAARRVSALFDRGGEGAHRASSAAGRRSWRSSRRRLAEQKGRHAGRHQVDRHRRHVAVRRLWLQSGRHSHRPEGKPAPARDQGLGQARVQGSRRRRRARHAQSQGRAAAAAQVRARRRGTRSSISIRRSAARRARAISTSTCGRSGATPSRC